MADQEVKIKYSVDGADDVAKKTNAIGSALTKLGTILKTGVIAALAGFATAIGLGIKEISEGEKVTAKLNQALVNTGKYSKEASKGLTDYANAMQRKVAFDDEAIIAAESSFAAFGLEQKQIEELTRVTADLAQAKGMDLASAADLVAKSVGSSTNAMARYGISIEGAAGSSQRVTQAISGLTTIFGGQAEAFGKTFPGQIAIFKNEVMNTAGSFTQYLMPAFTKGIELANKLLQSFSSFVGSSGMQQFMAGVGNAINTAFQYLKPFWESWKEAAANILPKVQSTFISLWNALKDIFKVLENLGVGGVIKGAFDIFLKGAEAVWTVVEKLANALEWVANALENITGKKVAVETENTSTEESATNGESSLEAMAAEEDAKTQLLLDKNAERKALLDAQKLEQRGMDDATYAEWKAIDDEAELVAFQEKLAKLNENGELTIQQEGMIQERMNQLKAQNYQKDFSSWLGVEKLKLVNKQSTAQQMDTWENFMLQGQKSKNKEVAAMAKALAIKNIIFKTAEAAMSAYGALALIPIVGPALGVIAAGAAIAFGSEQIQAVNSQTTELAEGGSMIVDSPTQIGNNVLAGEAGPEEIKVTPLGESQAQTINNNIYLDGELIATQVAKINQGQASEGYLDA
jgi:hypothetical protein